MYRSLSVSGFRGLRTANLTDFARINLISGRNDVGKTAILEALFLHASGPFAGGHALQYLQPARGQQPLELGQGSFESPWASFFEDFDLTRPITLLATTTEHGKYQLTLRAPRSEQDTQLPVGTSEGQLQLATAALQVEERRGEESPVVRTQSITVQGSLPAGGLGLQQVALNLRLEPPPNPALPFRSASLIRGGRQGADPDMAQAYSELRRRKSNIDLVAALQGVDERIRGLEILSRGGQSVLHVELDTGLVLPMSLLGDGPALLARCLLTMVQIGKGGTLLIDEVENGVHWSVLPHMWSTLHRAAERLDVQVFATTHSRECLAAAAKALQSRPDELRLYRLGPRDENGAPLVGVYDQKKLAAGLEMNLDLR